MASLPTLLQSRDPSSELPASALHLLPFHISYSGPAKIANYFPIVQTDSGNDNAPHTLYKSYFRGRMLVGVDVPLPDGYCGQVWKSNAPSVSSSNPKASTSRHIVDVLDRSSVDSYSASSPRRSPRKHASVPAPSINASTGKASSNDASVNKGRGRKKPAPLKRQRYAMSPDVSPVKETMFSSEATMAFEEALDIAAESLEKEDKDADNSTSSEEVFVTSPAKKRAKLERVEAEAGERAEAQESDAKEEAEADADTTMTLVAESTTTTLQAGGDTITSTTVKLERQVTPPPPPSSAVDTTVPSTPMTASAVLPINILSPQTPRTPRASFYCLSDQQQGADEQVREGNEGERIHQRLISQIATFNKITIWNPDMELDKGDDCYVKSLTEWTHLAEIVSFFFP